MTNSKNNKTIILKTNSDLEKAKLETRLYEVMNQKALLNVLLRDKKEESIFDIVRI